MNIYIGAHKDTDIIKRSSSGGAFSLLANYFIRDMNGIVYGCVFDSNLNAKHIRAESVEQTFAMRGSKYVQSNMCDSYLNVKKDLENNNKVMFTGTACQIQGLYSFLKLSGTDINNLYTVAVLCHGVASKKFFLDYIKHLETKYHSKAIYCTFRSKRRKDQKQGMAIKFDNGKEFYASTTNYDWFYSLYLHDYIQRPSCYKCAYKNCTFSSDIILADSWIKNYIPKVANSLIITKTDKGENLFINSSASNFLFSKFDSSMIRLPKTTRPDDYNEFWNIYLNQGYLEAQKYFGNNTFKSKCKSKVIDIIFKLKLNKLIGR